MQETICYPRIEILVFAAQFYSEFTANYNRFVLFESSLTGFGTSEFVPPPKINSPGGLPGNLAHTTWCSVIDVPSCVLRNTKSVSITCKKARTGCLCGLQIYMHRPSLLCAAQLAVKCLFVDGIVAGATQYAPCPWFAAGEEVRHRSLRGVCRFPHGWFRSLSAPCLWLCSRTKGEKTREAGCFCDTVNLLGVINALRDSYA